MNTTIVTALYDIGRGGWNPPFNRSMNDYLNYFRYVLSLDSNFIIFIEDSLYNKISYIRKEFDPFLFKTKIITRKISDLEVFQKYYATTRTVMSSEVFLRNLREYHTPESIYPEYNLININKVSFLEEAIQLNPFNSDYFMWMDAGFLHGKFPEERMNKVYPDQEKIKILDDNRVHFLCLSKEEDACLDSFFSSRVTLAGSMFAGRKEPLLKFKKICLNVVEEFLAANAMNDDQTIYAYAYAKDKQLFNLYQGDWFENFKIFV